jgi:hypothetical protein
MMVSNIQNTDETEITQASHDILLKLSNEEYRRLIWLSRKLELSISETLRSFIPNVAVPADRVIEEEKDIAAASPFDLIPVNKSFKRESIKKLLDEIQSSNAAVTLANEIRQQLIDSQGMSLTVETYKRLGRWCHPYRWTEREKLIQPIAQQISILLFKKVIDRSNT